MTWWCGDVGGRVLMTTVWFVVISLALWGLARLFPRPPGPRTTHGDDVPPERTPAHADPTL